MAEEAKPEEKPVEQPAAPAPDAKLAEQPAASEEKPVEQPAAPKVDPSAELAGLRTALEEVSAKLSKMEAAATSPGTDPTEAENVLKARWEADLAELPAEAQAALKEIAGDSVLVGVKALTALQKAGLVGAKPKSEDKPAPSDRQMLDGGGQPQAPATFDEAAARVAASLGNARL